MKGWIVGLQLLISGFAPGLLMAYQLNGLSWPQPYTDINVDFSLDGQRRSDSGIRWNDAFEQAADQWNTQTAFDLTVNKNVYSDPCEEADTRNGSAYTEDECGTAFGEGVLAVTYSYYYTNNPDEVVEADILFNAAEEWDVYDGPLRTEIDFRRVAVHEIGHLLGLGHEQVEVAIMAPKVSSLTVPQADDLEGVAALYGSEVPAPIIIQFDDLNRIQSTDFQPIIQTYSGWAISLHGLRSLKVYLDGDFRGDLVQGGPTPEVCSQYPAYPDCAAGGFTFVSQFGVLAPGTHRVRIDAEDTRGNTQSKQIVFSIVQ